jgi:HprK-related kinase B
VTESAGALAARLAEEAPLRARLRLRFGGCRIDVESNEPALLDRLRAYYTAFDDGVEDGGPPDFDVRVHHMHPPELGLAYEHWEREPGKDRGKEAFVELPDGRAIRKVRTDMQFLVGRELRVAFGDCARNPNQIVNFVNFQYTAWHMNRGRALCHAAAVVQDGRALALVSLSGGGKSTLALRLVGEGFDFSSNDRVLAGRAPDGACEMWGVPKHPRVNPGTILHDPNLSGLLDPAREAELRRLPREELWGLEEKYDAVIDRLYGPGRIVVRAPLHALLVLAWSPKSREPARFEEVALREGSDVLDALMKSPGPFFVPDSPPRGARPARGYEPPDPRGYLDVLGGLPVLVARGGVDFDAGARRARDLLRAG